MTNRIVGTINEIRLEWTIGIPRIGMFHVDAPPNIMQKNAKRFDVK